MFGFIKKSKKERTQERVLTETKVQENFLFHNRGIIDVTYFDAMTPTDVLGYLCGGIIQLLSNGRIIIYSEEDKTILEDFNLKDVISGSKIDNQRHNASVALETNKKVIYIGFQNIEIQREFWDAITAVYDSLKIKSDGISNIIGYRFNETGIFGYTFYSTSGKICSSSRIVAPSAPVIIHGNGVTWKSDFDDDTTIFPGLSRSIYDESNGALLFQIVYKDSGEYEINGSITVYYDTGKYTFCCDDGVIAKISRLTGKKDYLQIKPDTNFDYEPYFEIVADGGIGTELLMVILTFPMLQFGF